MTKRVIKSQESVRICHGWKERSETFSLRGSFNCFKETVQISQISWFQNEEKFVFCKRKTSQKDFFRTEKLKIVTKSANFLLFPVNKIDKQENFDKIRIKGRLTK